MIASAYFATGGAESRDMAGLACYGGPAGPIGNALVLMCGGPLDAPHYMPAGSVNNRDWTNAKREAIARPSLIERNAA